MTEIFVVFPIVVVLIAVSKLMPSNDQSEETTSATDDRCLEIAMNKCWDCWEDHLECRCGGGEV